MKLYIILLLTFVSSLLYSVKPEKIEITHKAIAEISGIEMLPCCDSLVFAVNDSGNPSEVYVLTLSGKVSQIIPIPKQFKNNDWEDISAAQIGEPNQAVLFIADTGNNKLLKTSYEIVLLFITFKCGEDIPVQVDSLKSIKFTMDKSAYDAETLLYDTQSGNLYVITKWSEFSKVFEISHPLTRTSDVFPARFCGQLPISIATGGDLDDTGNLLVIKTYIEVYFWNRQPGESIGDMCSRTPDALLPYKSEPQGEAICWSPDNKFYYTLSERKSAKSVFLYKYLFSVD